MVELRGGKLDACAFKLRCGRLEVALRLRYGRFEVSFRVRWGRMWLD
jgi:hypothetical protein